MVWVVSFVFWRRPCVEFAVMQRVGIGTVLLSEGQTICRILVSLSVNEDKRDFWVFGCEIRQLLGLPCANGQIGVGGGWGFSKEQKYQQDPVLQDRPIQCASVSMCTAYESLRRCSTKIAIATRNIYRDMRLTCVTQFTKHVT